MIAAFAIAAEMSLTDPDRLAAIRTRSECERANKAAVHARMLMDTYIGWDSGHCRLISLLEQVGKPAAFHVQSKPAKSH